MNGPLVGYLFLALAVGFFMGMFVTEILHSGEE